MKFTGLIITFLLILPKFGMAFGGACPNGDCRRELFDAYAEIAKDLEKRGIRKYISRDGGLSSQLRYEIEREKIDVTACENQEEGNVIKFEADFVASTRTRVHNRLYKVHKNHFLFHYESIGDLHRKSCFLYSVVHYGKNGEVLNRETVEEIIFNLTELIPVLREISRTYRSFSEFGLEDENRWDHFNFPVSDLIGVHLKPVVGIGKTNEQ